MHTTKKEETILHSTKAKIKYLLNILTSDSNQRHESFFFC